MRIGGRKRKTNVINSSSFMHTWHPKGNWMPQGGSRPIEPYQFERSSPGICEAKSSKKIKERRIKERKRGPGVKLESKGKMNKKNIYLYTHTQ